MHLGVQPDMVTTNEKGTYRFRRKSLFFLVPRERIELPTRGFSVPCSTN